MEQKLTRKEKDIRIRRYSRYLHNYGRSSYPINEAVIHVDKYLNVLKDVIRECKKDLLKEDRLENKIKKLNLALKSFKIEFVLMNRRGNEVGIIQGNFKQEFIQIWVGQNLEFSLENEERFNIFLKFLFPLLGHELVHRGQWYKSKNDFLNFYAFENEEEIKKMQLEDKWEIMAYALMAIETFRYAGYTNNALLKKFKLDLEKGEKFPYNISNVMDLYLLNIKKLNFEVYKRFLKYIYDYLKNPIQNDLKVEI